MNAGKYSTSFTFKKASLNKDNTTGQDKYSYADNGTVWGSLDYTNANVEEDYGAKRGKTRATIRLRQYVPITTLDRLFSKQFEETWMIEGIRFGNNETILDVYEYEAI